MNLDNSTVTKERVVNACTGYLLGFAHIIARV